MPHCRWHQKVAKARLVSQAGTFEFFFYNYQLQFDLMRLFKFLSRFAFICNIAFLLFVFFRWLELKKPANGNGEKLVAVPFFKDLIITLGICAIVINLLMNIFYFLFLMRGKIKNMGLWLPVVNFIFLLLQIFYFFVY